jgi:hypothetical protein
MFAAGAAGAYLVYRWAKAEWLRATAPREETALAPVETLVRDPATGVYRPRPRD